MRMAVAIVSGLLDRVAQHDRRGAGRLEAEHPRLRVDAARGLVSVEAGPVGGDVAGVADGDGQDVGRPAEVVADLEGGRRLAVDPVRVDVVDQRDRVFLLLGHLADNRQRLVEVALDGDDLRAGDERLDQLAQGDLALRQDDDHFQPGGGAVGRGRGGGVAGGERR